MVRKTLRIVFAVCVILSLYLMISYINGRLRKSGSPHQHPEHVLAKQGTYTSLIDGDEIKIDIDEAKIDMDAEQKYLNETMLNFNENDGNNPVSGDEVTSAGFVVNPPENKAVVRGGSTGKTTAILISTNMRSGSTFTGMLFQQHPDVFYVYEPLHGFRFEDLSNKIPYKCNESPDRMCAHQVPKGPVEDLLSNLYTCRIPWYYREYFDKRNKYGRSRAQPYLRCGNVNACGRVCPSYDPATGPTAEQICSRFDHIVIKSTRTGNFDYLKSLAERDDIDFKIIHLLRDPRAIENSRVSKKIYNVYHPSVKHDPNMLKKDSAYLCQRIANNIRLGRTAPWLEGRYMLVRYEDIAARPVELAEKMMKFVGLGVTDSVMKFIEKEAIGAGGHESDSEPSAAAMRSQGWRRQISWTTTKTIQTECQALFDSGVTGYLWAANETVLKDRDVSLMLEL